MNKLYLKKDNPNIFYENDDEPIGKNKRKKWRDEYKHKVILYRIFNFLRSIGWNIEHDTTKHKCIRYSHFCGKYKELEFKADFYPAGFKLEFFQNINFENRNGGYYDFDRYYKMPYLTKKRFLLTCNKVKEFCEKELKMPVNWVFDKSKLSAIDWVKLDYVTSWHHAEKNMNFDLDKTANCEYSYNNRDKNDIPIKQGDIKYFVNYKTKRIARGKCYHNINNMYWVILNNSEFHNVASRSLFDKPEELRGRFTKQKELTDEQKLRSENRKLKNQLKNIQRDKKLKRINKNANFSSKKRMV